LNNEILKVNQVAELLQVTTRTVCNLCTRGRFPGAYKFDPMAKRSDWLIPRHDLNEFLQSRQPIKNTTEL